jgi:hypothetical protein
MADILYTAEKTCVICDKQFTVTKVRNRLSMVKQDSDFCTYYKEVNPTTTQSGSVPTAAMPPRIPTSKNRRPTVPPSRNSPPDATSR